MTWFAIEKVFEAACESRKSQRLSTASAVLRAQHKSRMMAACTREPPAWAEYTGVRSGAAFYHFLLRFRTDRANCDHFGM